MAGPDAPVAHLYDFGRGSLVGAEVIGDLILYVYGRRPVSRQLRAWVVVAGGHRPRVGERIRPKSAGALGGNL